MSAVPQACEQDEVRFWGGPGFHIVTYPLRHKAVLNIVAVFETPTFAERLGREAAQAEFHRAFAGIIVPDVRATLGTMDLERRWTIADRDPIRHWHKGRVVLLGDAAHAALQSLAQGACMAIEDAVVLADLIHTTKGDFARAFATYETSRCARTARVILEGRHMWEMYHADGVHHDAWWQVFAERKEEDNFQCLAWLYDGFKVPDGVA
jgi:salicylate hydroxylase